DHGHARREGRGDRRPHPLPRRRRDRARARLLERVGGHRRTPRGHPEMTSVALRGLLGRKLRALLTALSIVLGVAMVSGSLVLTDSIQQAFHTLFSSSYANTDAVITGKKLVDYSNSGNATIPAGLLATVRAQPDVARAEGVINDMSGGALSAKLYDKQGKIITGGGNPTMGVGIDPAATEFNPMHL